MGFEWVWGKITIFPPPMFSALPSFSNSIFICSALISPSAFIFPLISAFSASTFFADIPPEALRTLHFISPSKTHEPDTESFSLTLQSPPALTEPLMDISPAEMFFSA